MIAALEFVVRYQAYLFAALGVVGLVYLAMLAGARRRLAGPLFGLEREDALRRQNRALTVLAGVVLLVLVIAVLDTTILPELSAPPPTPADAPQPTASPSPVAVEGPVVVDSSGCENPEATLTKPEPGERLVGAYEVLGTANIPNLAYYKFEISGASTGGEWISLGVNTAPVVEGVLGRFDAGARETGDYAFRLVVVDSAGTFPPPCVIPVTIVGLQAP
jgi:hypothetical protein